MNREALELAAQIADVTGAVLWGGTTRNADFFTDRWLSYVGETGADWMRHGWETAFHPDDQARCTIAWHQTLSQRTVGDVEVRLRTVTGDYRWHRVRFVMAGDQQWFGVAFDLGERSDDTPSRGQAAARSARGDAMQAAELKDHFLAAVSHELRAPIAALLLWERLLRDGELSPDEKMRALDAIHNSAMAQSRLVDDLIDVARISTGKLEVRLEPVWIEKVLDAALQEITPAVAAKQHELVVEVETDLGSVDGDAVRLVQVLVNLLTNAVNFTPSHGRVAVTARREAVALVIEVADNGCGIEREYLPRVFDLFSQFDGGSTREQMGLGLGLAIAHELVELHGGTITAFSEGLGTGARFVIRLPAGRARVTTPIPEVPSVRPLDGITVLVVDDDVRVLEALELLLKRAGANVTGVRSVADGWRALESSAFDIVVSDLAMPLADGYELVQRMREDPRLARVPAIALTAHATSGDIERARNRGFDLHLAKPVRFDHLVAGISSLARR